MPGWGRHSYEAYVAAGDEDAGKSSVTGEKLPSWENQRPGIRARWDKAADAAINAYLGEMGKAHNPPGGTDT